MNRVNMGTLPGPFQQFMHSMAAAPDGSILEQDGRPVIRVTPVSGATGTPAGPWTPEKNDRRCDLIDREVDGTLTPEERAEWEDLQGQMLRYRHRVAPLPLAHAQRLLDELERKAAAGTGIGQSGSLENAHRGDR